jgi:glutathione S-transferase
MGRLFTASYSPYTERAVWVLDHHGIPYRRVEHTPMLGEPLLRARTGRWRGKVTIPMYVTDEGLVIGDGVEIARHVDERGTGAKLFLDGVDPWIERSNRILEAGRARLLPRLLASREANRESLPGWVPGFLRGALTGLARVGTRYLGRKYDIASLAGTAAAVIRAAVDELRAGLAVAKGRRLVGGKLSFADVTMAVALQMVRPVEHPAMPLGPASRVAWTDEELAGECADVLAWRDEIYAGRTLKA